MASNKNDIQNLSNQQEFNKISKGSFFKGDITSDGDFRIDGKIEGSVTTESKVVLGETGFFKGHIECARAEIFGQIEGSIHAQEYLSVKKSAVIKGDIVSPLLGVEQGAVIVGRCNMTSKDQ